MIEELNEQIERRKNLLKKLLEMSWQIQKSVV
jgi:hypothetical protein